MKITNVLKRRKHKYDLEVFLNGKLVFINTTGFTITRTLDPAQIVITIPEDIAELLK